mmetsp:Transcript_58954/g.133466  ORF Transcript_58954/g.133466 Transcript_58954/m.133466 type:complete len:215 (+) Transcript_58954:13-657(+)
MIRVPSGKFLVAASLLLVTARGDNESITCGSLAKLTHVESNFLLHSHEISYGSGSKQQSVTAIESHDDQGNLWLVKEAYGLEACQTGEPISCGSMIRLEHALSERNLHTHTVQSPLSLQQEVSCFERQEEGDVNDNWKVLCERPNERYWMRGSPVRFQSDATGAVLHSHSQHRFDERNCPRCPIVGQQEVTAFTEENEQVLALAVLSRQTLGVD